jgi:hypothetical protein
MDQIIGRGKENDPRHLPLFTSRRQSILNEQLDEFSPAQLKAAVQQWEQFALKNGAVLRSIRAAYNCMSLVFANRRTWVFVGELEKIFRDDGYVRLADSSGLKVGDLVVYRKEKEFRHVGIVVDIKRPIDLADEEIITVNSKWGADGEYVHPIGGVPEIFGKEVEFWTERKIP